MSSEHQPKTNEISAAGIKFILEPRLAPFCGPLYFNDNFKSAAGMIPDNGSFGLLDTGKKKLLITCAHVWTGLIKYREKRPSAMLHICLRQSKVVILPFPPIDCDERLDIATFDMEPVLKQCPGSHFFPFHPNPTPPLKIGDHLFLLGYPGMFRNTNGPMVGFGRATYALNVTSINGERFQADMTESVFLTKAKVRAENPHGGMSGSPCYLIRENYPSRMVGILTGYYLKHLFFSPTSRVNRDGTINRLPH